MTEEKPQDTQAEAPQEPQADAPVQLTVDDIKSIIQLRDLILKVGQDHTNWATVRIKETGYLQAVQAELSLHRTDLHAFALTAMCKLVMELQDELARTNVRISDLTSTVLDVVVGKPPKVPVKKGVKK